MEHWLDEAEKKHKNKVVDSELNSDSRNLIVTENQQKIKPFIDSLKELITRVQLLSPEEKPCNEIGFTYIDGDIRYEFYGSAFRDVNKKFLLLFNKNRKYLFWRRLYLTLTNTPEMFKITMYEKGQIDYKDNGAIKKKYKFLIKLKTLSPSFSYQLIDWLVFKTDIHTLKKHIPSVT